MQVEVVIPDLGGADDVTVVEVFVQAGDTVAVDDSLVALESEKASMDVPSTHVGEVIEVHLNAGDSVTEGQLLVTLEVDESEKNESEDRDAERSRPPAAPSRRDDEDGRDAPARRDDEDGEEAPSRRDDEGGEAQSTDRRPPTTGHRPAIHDSRFTNHDASFRAAYASPAVRRFARELGVDLGRVDGTGRKGRITRDDVTKWVKSVLAGGGPVELPEQRLIPQMPQVDFAKWGSVERQLLTRIQKASGPNLHRSWLHVPHVTQFDEADITDMEALRQEKKAEAAEQDVRLTPLAFVLQAVVAALKEYPLVNSSLDAEAGEVILKQSYHLGVAVDTPGGLVVPVIRDVDQKGAFDLARELADISGRAREGKLKIDELTGASFTISSLGGIGGTGFTPIVNAPEVGILGVARSRMTPVWDPDQEKFSPRLILPFSLSYDHRVVDGALGVRFTRFLAGQLEDAESFDL